MQTMNIVELTNMSVVEQCCIGSFVKTVNQGLYLGNLVLCVNIWTFT